ncbi:MAG: sulfite exporter TauE/SafE family protein, partial [Planctomycetales bacterium]
MMNVPDLDALDMDGLLGILIVIGLATGTLTGLTGATGMSVLISGLLFAGIEIRQVIGLTFAVTLGNAAVSIGAYWKHGHVDARVGLLTAAAAMATVMLGHAVSHSVKSDALTGVMIACLFLVGVKFLIPSRDQEQSNIEPPNIDSPKVESSTVEPAARPWAAGLILMGCGAGFVMGIMGGGGAVFLGAAFILLFKMEAKTAIGTSILTMGLAAIPGVAFHWFSGTIDVSHAAVILAAS